MKARLRLQDKLSNKQKKDIDLYCSESLRKQQTDLVRRMTKIFCVVLNQQFGFGKDRCYKAINAFNELSNRRDYDEVFWTHVDRLLEHIGLNFPQEDYEKMDR